MRRTQICLDCLPPAQDVNWAICVATQAGCLGITTTLRGIPVREDQTIRDALKESACLYGDWIQQHLHTLEVLDLCEEHENRIVLGHCSIPRSVHVPENVVWVHTSTHFWLCTYTLREERPKLFAALSECIRELCPRWSTC